MPKAAATSAKVSGQGFGGMGDPTDQITGRFWVSGMGGSRDSVPLHDMRHIHREEGRDVKRVVVSSTVYLKRYNPPVDGRQSTRTFWLRGSAVDCKVAL